MRLFKGWYLPCCCNTPHTRSLPRLREINLWLPELDDHVGTASSRKGTILIDQSRHSSVTKQQNERGQIYTCKILPPATPPCKSSTSDPGLLTSNDLITIICGGEVKSLTGTGIFLQIYSHTASTLYFSWAEMGTTGAPSAIVPLMKSAIASCWFWATLSLQDMRYGLKSLNSALHERCGGRVDGGLLEYFKKLEAQLKTVISQSWHAT